MKMIRERWIALSLSIGAALLSVLPYIIAWGLAPEKSAFHGFLINPIDGFSYLSKMRQGAEGYWTLLLPYAPDPGPRVFLFVYYLLLGQISRITSLGMPWIFHIARFLAASLLFYLAYLLNEQISPHRQVRWFGFGVIVLGSGMGWLSLFIENLPSSDILVPESIPFLIAYSNAHFPMAASALLAAILAALAQGWFVWKRVALAGLSGMLLGALLPFSFVSLFVILVLWFLVELWSAWKSKPSKGNLKGSMNMGITLVACLIGALPWLLYDLWLSIDHPVIAAWNAQNQTPSPAPLAYLVGFAPILIFGAFGLVRGKPWRTGKGRLLLVWLLSGALLLYAPVAFQRRLSLGLAFPLGILAAWGWGSIPMRIEFRKPLTVLILLVFSLTNLMIVFAGIQGVARGQPEVVINAIEAQSYAWIQEHVEPGSLVLAGEMTGNRLPAYANVRVLYGHPFETPNAQSQVELVTHLYQDADVSVHELRELGVTWVYYGMEEQELGQPAWLEALELSWGMGEIAIYKVPPA